MLNAELLLDALGDVRPDYVLQAQALLSRAAPRPRRLWRTALLAAALAALLGATAYALGSIHQRRQEELRQDLRIEENRVAGYVQGETPGTPEGEPRAVLLAALPDFDDFIRFYVNVSPVPEEWVRDGRVMSAAVNLEEDWDLEGVHYFTSLDGEGWQEALIHTRDWDFAPEDVLRVTDPDTGMVYDQPSIQAVWDKERRQGYDPETKTLTLESVFHRDDLPPEADEAVLQVICVRYLAAVDESGRETRNDAGLLRDFGTVAVPLVQPELRTVYFSEPRAFTVPGSEITGRLVGAELSATGLTWLYEFDGSYSLSEALIPVTDALEADAFLELADGSRKAVSVSVRSEAGPLLRNICGFSGTLDIHAVTAIQAGGERFTFRDGP